MGLDQINDAISQMDAVTQQNAALVVQAAAAAESMKQQAASLKEAVSIFKINECFAVAKLAPVRAATRHIAPPRRLAMRSPALAPQEQEWEEL